MMADRFVNVNNNIKGLVPYKAVKGFHHPFQLSISMRVFEELEIYPYFIINVCNQPVHLGMYIKESDLIHIIKGISCPWQMH